MSKKKSKFGCFSAIGLLIALTAAGGYVVKKGWHQLLIGQSLNPLSGAKVISNEAVMTSLIYTDSDHWQKAESLSVNPGATALSRVTSEIEQELTALNINYEEDIQSWLGNAMVAVIPQQDNEAQPNILIVLGIKNPFNAYQFFRKVKAAEKGELEFTDYKNKRINIINNQQGEKVNVALLGNKIVLSDDVSAIKQAIDTYQGEPSLAEDLNGKIALRQPFKFRNELVKVYITNYNYILNNSNYSTPSQNKLAELQPVTSVAFGMGVEDNQLNLQSFAEINPDFIPTETKSNNNEILNQLPEETIAFVSGQGINEFWSGLVAIGEKDRDVKQTIEGIRTATKWTTGLDLDQDVFNWMDGEFALGIVSTNRTIIPELNLKLGTVMLFESSDRDTANNTLNALDNQIQQQLGVASLQKQFKQQTVNQLSVPNSNLNLSYGWIDKKNLLLTFGSGVFESLENDNQSSLAKSLDFKQIAQELPKKNQGYFYFNVEKALIEFKQIPGLPIDYDSETVKTIESIKSIGATSSIVDSDTSKLDMVILFKDN